MLTFTRFLKSLGLHVRTTLIAGVLIIVPVVITVVILRFVFDFFDGLLQPLFEQFLDFYTPGMGIAALVIIIYLSGLVTIHAMGRRLIGLGHAMVELIPGVRAVYRTARHATGVFSVSSNGNFTGVVLVEFPGYGLRSIGLVTGETKDEDGNILLAVYVPTSPFPTSGFLVVLLPEQVTPIDMPVDDAMKLIVSAGIMIPDKITKTPIVSREVPDVSGGFPNGAPAPDDGKERPHGSDGHASNQ